LIAPLIAVATRLYSYGILNSIQKVVRKTVKMLLKIVMLLDSALPYLMTLAALLVLTGNFASRYFLETAGFNLRQRQLTGLFLAASSAAMFTGITSCHATTLLIMLLSLIAVTALRRGGRRVAFGSATVATLLTPLVIVS